MMPTWPIATAAAVVTLLAMPFMIRVLWRVRAIDEPGERSSHVTATPRGGGAVPVAVLVASGLVLVRPGRIALGLVVPVAMMLVIGLLEDLRSLRVGARLVAQVVAMTSGVILATQQTDVHVVAVLVAIGAGICWINVFNFMDGIDGLASSQVIVVGIAWLWIGAARDLALGTQLGAVSLGATAGFLPFNFPRARVFLGDTGSYGLGAWVAMGSLLLWLDGVPLVLLVAPLVVFVFDSAETIARRFLRRERLTSAHRSHTYQRLAARIGHTRTTLIVSVAMLTFSVLALSVDEGSTRVRVAAAGVAAVLLLTYRVSAPVIERWVTPQQ